MYVGCWPSRRVSSRVRHPACCLAPVAMQPPVASAWHRVPPAGGYLGEVAGYRVPRSAEELLDDVAAGTMSRPLRAVPKLEKARLPPSHPISSRMS